MNRLNATLDSLLFAVALPFACFVPRHSSNLSQANLNNLMIWYSYTVAKQLTCEQLPVWAILKEFREMAGIRGRNAHRGTTPPKYELGT